MTSYARADRVGGLIQQMLSELLRKGISDPRLRMATITQVKVTRDLRLARIYFTSAGGKEASEQTALGFRESVSPNQCLVVDEAAAGPRTPPLADPPTPLFSDVTQLLAHKHHEEDFDDFAREPLLPRKLSQLGPGVAWFDVDADGIQGGNRIPGGLQIVGDGHASPGMITCRIQRLRR